VRRDGGQLPRQRPEWIALYGRSVLHRDETCTAGVCGSSTGDPCVESQDGDEDCQESCNEAGDNCLANDPNGSDCNDLLGTTISDACSAGTCVGTAGPEVTITSPSHNTFSSAGTQNVQGTIANAQPTQSVSVNQTLVSASGATTTFSSVQSLPDAAYFHPLHPQSATVTVPGEGSFGADYVNKDRVMVIKGTGTPDAICLDTGLPGCSPSSVNLRINDSGLDKIEGIVTSLVPLDPAALFGNLPVQVAGYSCAQTNPIFGGCLASINRADLTAISFGSYGIALDSLASRVFGRVTINNVAVTVAVDGGGLLSDCTITVTASRAEVDDYYTLSAFPENTTVGDDYGIDVNEQLPANPIVTLFDDNVNANCGGLLAFIIEPIVEGQVRPLLTDGLVDFLSDPDGTGEQDAPIAGAVQDGLGGLSIAGPIGESLGVLLKTPVIDVFEDAAGLTVNNDSSVTLDPNLPPPPANAPNFLASFRPTPEESPSFAATSPSGVAYDLAITLGTSAFNQLLKALVEAGLFTLELAELDLGFGNQPIDANLLSILIPEILYTNAPTEPMVVRINPLSSPLLSGDVGPLACSGGSQANNSCTTSANCPGGTCQQTLEELLLGQLGVEVYRVSDNTKMSAPLRISASV